MKVFERVAATLSYLKQKTIIDGGNPVFVTPEISAKIVGVSTVEFSNHLKILHTLDKIKLNDSVVEVL